MKITHPKQKSLKEVKNFFNRKYPYLIKLLNEKIEKKLTKFPYISIYQYMYNIYNYLKLNRRLVVLEFGSGWSSLIFLIALNELIKENSKILKEIKIDTSYEIFILENSKKYLNYTKQLINKYFKYSKTQNFCKINYFHSDVYMSTFDNRIVTEYKKLPLCNPDFIYLDGPDQFNIKGKINGFSTRHKNLMPMASDILKIEYFLVPGTIILVDGRASNTRFLKDHFKRKWIYNYDNKSDLHSFLLDEKPLGKKNLKILKLYKNK